MGWGIAAVAVAAVVAVGAIEGAPAAVDEGTRAADAAAVVHVALSWADGDGAPAARRWVRPAHDVAELRARRAEIVAELARLDAGERARVAPLVEIISAVSTVEGSFGDPTRIATDTAASIGLLQWAAPRERPVDASTSLYDFLAAIHARARRGDALGKRARAELAAAGITLAGERALLHRRAVPARELVTALLPVAGSGATRTIQLALAADAVEALLAMRLRGRPLGAWFPTVEGRALLFSLRANRPGWVRGVAESALKAPEADRISALRRAAIERYPASDRARRARRYATCALLPLDN